MNQKDTEKDTENDTEKDTQEDTEQPRSSRSKQTSTYPGPSVSLQGWVPLPLHIVRCLPGHETPAMGFFWGVDQD